MKKSPSAWLFVLATALSTCGMILLEPWVISEAIDGAGIPLRYLFGYALIAMTALANGATAILVARVRGWQFTGAKPLRKFSSAAAGLALATALFLISCTIGSFSAQLIVQP